MTEPITFTQLLIFGGFILTLIGLIIKIGWSVWRIKRNDFGGFIKRDEFESLEKTVTATDKAIAVLKTRTDEQDKKIDTLFKWKNSK